MWVLFDVVENDFYIEPIGLLSVELSRKSAQFPEKYRNHITTDIPQSPLVGFKRVELLLQN
jgi:hypothetical protein